MDYKEAITRLEAIVNQIDNNELEVDQLAEKIKEANTLIAYCTDRLAHADDEVGKLLSKPGDEQA